MAAKAGILSYFSVIITALPTCFFCHWALGFSYSESFLIGAVLSSTDAVFVIALALPSYSFPTLIGKNGFLSV